MTLPTDFDVTIEFLSDWHVGTGQGRLGSVDAVVRRDAAGLPFVPAKTLLGVWRDACETVAATFDRAADRPDAWTAWVAWLFGDQDAAAGRLPAPAALRLTPGYAPAWLRNSVRGRPELAQAAVVLRPGVSIDGVTGTVADRLLRVEERAIRGLNLRSRVSVVLPEPTGAGAQLPEPAELMLRAGARLIEALGGKRNRGGGRVAVLLPDAVIENPDVHPTLTDDRLADLLAAGVPATPPPPPATPPVATFHPYDRTRPDRRRTVRVVLRVVTPVVAAKQVLGNLVIGRDAIPGTALLGTMLAHAQPGHGDRRGRIGLADIGVGDAVPAVGDPDDPVSVRPAAPVPAAWQRGDKGQGASVHNSLVRAAQPGARAKGMNGWIVPDGDRWRVLDPATAASTHAVVDDDARRPTVASGGVYSYLGIAADSLLCSDVVLPADVELRLRSGDRLRFGRSRKDDYGLVEVVDVVELAAPPRPVAPVDGRLRVWCVSDVLLRDDRLNPDPSPHGLARALTTALAPASCAVPECQPASATGVGAGTDAAAEPGTAVEAVTAAERRDGFGVAWGRPRPSQVALRAGSVVTLEVTGTPDPDRLAGLERDGLGERTAEGYGRIRFNPPELTVERPSVAFSDAAPARDAPADPDPQDIPDDPDPLEINAWRRVIRRASAELEPDALIPGIGKMAKRRAQLGALRAQLERLTLPGGSALVRHWIDGTRAVRARRDAWGEDTLRNLAALLLDDANLIWQRLDLHGPMNHLVLAPGREDRIREGLRTEAVVTTVTDALRKLLRGDARSRSTREEH
ncbi:RAMP superfamily CRISPR-associated protein [Plantactinospora sp. KBS50]|uniref:RAMP superfamily CRISPR-associated protein n=1 Tax=Plantactinospora sp. KBS50 TaxID=2024580 RepID=UPI000BAAEA0C|nr:RAMP superfamily CRISPR-associated protein [Plantactinospora sp. KBS50]ASW55506.1 hypothetical protein CIK06_16985 [Plantactinospora sp. KBS50]